MKIWGSFAQSGRPRISDLPIDFTPFFPNENVMLLHGLDDFEDKPHWRSDERKFWTDYLLPKYTV